MASPSGGRPTIDQGIVALLASDYGLRDVRLDRFSPDHNTYCAATAADCRVVRVGSGLHRLAAAHRALEAAEYPAPRVISSINGAYVSTLSTEEGTQDAVVLTFVKGATPRFNRTDLHALGTALGHLHRHGTSISGAAASPAGGLPAIERAGMLPANELRFGLRQLLPAEDQLPNRTTAEQWRRLMVACEAGLKPNTELTQTFLHGDAHPWNSVVDASGEAQYIDWDSAGPGPAIIDLAFLVVSCATGGLTYPYSPADPGAVTSLLAGYRDQMDLTTADLDAMNGAVAFRVLVCAAAGFGHFLRQGRDPLAEPDIQWSLRRLEEGPRIADTIRGVLSR